MNEELKTKVETISFLANVKYKYIIEQDMLEFTLPPKMCGYDLLRISSEMLLRFEVPFIVSLIRKEINNRTIKLQEIKNEATKKNT